MNKEKSLRKSDQNRSEKLKNDQSIIASKSNGDEDIKKNDEGVLVETA